jgi:hypothetical protein
MIPVLLALGRSTIDECVAPTTFSPLNDKNYTLKHVQIVTRHGARSPLDPFLPRQQRGAWRCDSTDAQSGRIEAVPLSRPRRVRTILDNRFAEYPPNCRLGDLIVEGMQQHLQLGKAMRSYLIDNLSFLPETLDPTLMYVRCTSYDRTYRSALSFLAGLYEPESPYEILDIVSGSPSLDALRPKKDFCADFERIYNEYFESDEFKAIFTETRDAITPVFEHLNISKESTDFKKLDKICDWVITMFCNDKAMPDTITPEIITKCREYQGKMLFGFYGHSNATRGIPFSYGFREMKRILDGFIGGSTTEKFALLSAHDSTVAAFLSLLGYSNKFTPPLASHVIMEVYTYEPAQELYIRFVFNGEPLPLLLMDNKVLVPLHDFMKMIEPLTLPYCKEMP